MKTDYKKYLPHLLWLAPVGLFFLLLPLLRKDFQDPTGTRFGFTFSSHYAEELGLEWSEVYLAMLADLQVKTLRLPAYWDRVERVWGVYNFAELDYQLAAANQYGAQIILAVGRRLPRWPECHDPIWLSGLNKQELNTAQLAYIQAVVNRYKNDPAIVAWQVENEPFLSVFGECPRLDFDLFKQEIELVRSLDSRPIVVTESGELSTWLRGGQYADILGVSVYKVTWNNFWGYFYYPIPPAYYYYKSKLIEKFTKVDKVISTELQVEPWTAVPITSVPLTDQYISMDLTQARRNVDFARRTGFSEVYLWGVEWWYWLKVKHDNSVFWDWGKSIFND